jgi:hypothetical protein
MSLPIKKFGVGGISVAIWENEGKEGNGYCSVSFERRYKDKGGEWKSTTSLKANDLPKAILALEKAYEFIALKAQEPEQGNEKALAQEMA